MNLKDAVSRVYGEEVAITVLRQVAFDAGLDLNRALSAKLRPVKELDDELKALLSVGDEPEIKDINPEVAVHAVNLCTSALRDLSDITEADDQGRKSKPHAWLAGASNVSGRPHISTVGTVLVDAVNFRATSSNDHALTQMNVLKINGHMTDTQLESAKEVNAQKAADDAQQALRDRVALIPNWKLDYEQCRQLDLADLAQELETTVANLGWDLDGYVKAACAKSIEFSKERLMAGGYVNINPDVAALAA
jgi:hypothetical protein